MCARIYHRDRAMSNWCHKITSQLIVVYYNQESSCLWVFSPGLTYKMWLARLLLWTTDLHAVDCAFSQPVDPWVLSAVILAKRHNFPNSCFHLPMTWTLYKQRLRLGTGQYLFSHWQKFYRFNAVRKFVYFIILKINCVNICSFIQMLAKIRQVMSLEVWIWTQRVCRNP